MKKFKVMKNGVCTNQWKEDFAGADYYEESFGEPGSYELAVEDISVEVAAKEAEKVAADQVHQFLKKLKKTDLIDVASCANAIMKIVKHIRADE